MPDQLSPQTRLIHECHERSQFGETSEALYLTQGFVYESMEQAERRFLNEESGYTYARFDNPTVTLFEQRMALLEGAEAARATASGMAAITAALMAQVKAGDHVVAAKAMFGSCRYIVETLMPRYGIESTLVDGMDLKAWKAAVRPNTRVFFLETPTNPKLEILDIRAVADIAHAHGATLVVDNVFATPMLQKPLELGADIVAYSATKHIDGQGRCLGGVVLGKADFITGELQMFLRQTGPTLSAFNAWVLLKGLETLPLRVKQQSANAERVAQALSLHPKVERIYYPGRDDHPQAELARKQMLGGSTIVAFDVKGTKATAFKLGKALQIIKISNNLGDAKSLITHPSTTTHQRMGAQARAELGITDNLLRLSVGLEDADDLVWDLAQALDQI
jgi:O-succinylhomoserine sulfhydrylase